MKQTTLQNLTPMQELLDYIKNAHTFTFLPNQLA